MAVISDIDLDHFTTNDHVPSAYLVTFGEAKHMSAFAELVAGFIGMVHELQPRRLRRVRVKGWRSKAPLHPAPFLFVSGKLWQTAEGVVETISRRKYDIDVYWKAKMMSDAIALPTGGHPSSAPHP